MKLEQIAQIHALRSAVFRLGNGVIAGTDISKPLKIREESNMGSVPSRIVGVIWIDEINPLLVPNSRFSLAPNSTARFRLPPTRTSIVPADLQQLESELQAAFELATGRS